MPVTLLAQELEVTFTATDGTSVIDSILATNLSTGENIVLPGNETLILEQSTFIYNIKGLASIQKKILQTTAKQMILICR